MAFLKNKAFLMAVRTGMALTAMLFFTACGKEQDNNTVLYIDDNPVSRKSMRCWHRKTVTRSI